MLRDPLRRRNGNGKGDLPALPIRETTKTAMGSVFSKKLRVKVYEEVGENLVIAFSKTVPFAQESIKINGELYILNKAPEKILYEKDPITGLFLVPTIMYILHSSSPMDTHERRLENVEPKPAKVSADARKIARVANKEAWHNVYPSTETMLQLIAMCCVIGMMISLGLNVYLISDPDASKNLRNLVTNTKPAPASTDENPTAYGQPGSSNTVRR